MVESVASESDDAGRYVGKWCDAGGVAGVAGCRGYYEWVVAVGDYDSFGDAGVDCGDGLGVS